MKISRRSGSSFFDIDVFDGDAHWYCTDRFNASGPLRLGGGRLRLRNVQWKNETLISNGDIDYSLKVSRTPDSEQYWVGNQAGRESDMTDLRLWVDETEVPMLSPGQEMDRVNSIRIQFWTQFLLDDGAATPFARNRWTYEWTRGSYSFDLQTEYLQPVRKWYEHSSNTPTDGSGGNRNPWKCFRVQTDASVYDGLGAQSRPSVFHVDGPGESLTMFLRHESRFEGAGIQVRSSRPTHIQVVDHGDQLVQASHITADGARFQDMTPGRHEGHQHTMLLSERTLSQ